MEKQDTSFIDILFGLSIYIMFSSILILGYQIYAWLKSGTWFSLNLFLAVPYLPKSISDWILYPDSWIGVHKVVVYVLEETPISFAVFLLGFSLVILFNYLGDWERQNAKE